MDDEREPRPTVPLEQRFEPAVVVCVPVRNDQRTQVPDRDLQHVQVAGQRGRRKPAVVEQGAAATVRLNRDQSREAVLCDQLIPTTEIAYQVPADTVRACHQQIDEVVDHDRHLGTVDRLKPYHPLSGTNHLLHATEHVSLSRRGAQGSFRNTGPGESPALRAGLSIRGRVSCLVGRFRRVLFPRPCCAAGSPRTA